MGNESRVVDVTVTDAKGYQQRYEAPLDQVVTNDSGSLKVGSSALYARGFWARLEVSEKTAE